MYWVTGGASGIGAACADRLIRDGYWVVCADVAAPAVPLKGVEYLVLDVTDDEAWRATVSDVEARGPLDALVCSAGVVRFDTVEDCSVEEFRDVQEVNSKRHGDVPRAEAHASPDAATGYGIGGNDVLGSQAWSGRLRSE